MMTRQRAMGHGCRFSSPLSGVGAATLLMIFLAQAGSTASGQAGREGASPESATPCRWEQSDSFVALRRGDETLWQFNYGPQCAKPYFHPLHLPGVGTLTWEAPPDHPWHHALWFSWKTINGLNYWEDHPKAAESAGLTTWRRVAVTTRPDHSAHIELELAYHAPGQKPVLTEERTLDVSAPNGSGQFHIDWTATFQAGQEDVRLDRTPPPGQPGGKSYGGYAGLSVRFAKQFTDWRAVDSDGKITTQTSRIRIRARAVDFRGTIHGEPAGIAICDHPGNLNAPSPWYIIMSPARPMAYFSPAVIHDAPHTLLAGERLTLRYRILVHPGRLDRAALQREYQRFAQ